MLTIFGNADGGYCDGISRRNFLRIGALGIGGLTLPHLLRAEALGATTAKSSHTKAVIHLFLGGGPSQSDIFPNLEAPESHRSSFHRISTAIPGIPICEHMPRVAAMADKFIFFPGVHRMDGSHQPHCCFSGAVMSGGSLKEKQVFGPVGGRPSQGSYIAKLLGSSDGITPPYMLQNNVQGSGPGFLGNAYSAFTFGRGLSADMTLGGITLEELEDRRQLLKTIDRLRASVDNSGTLGAVDSFTQRAMGILTSPKLPDAINLDKEDPKVVDKYKNRGWLGGRDANVNLQLLRAMRLVEAGARYVAVGYGGWDTHQANDEIHAQKLPILDAGLATLVADLEQRGMLEDVTLLAWGEMGRGSRYSKAVKDPATGITGRGRGHHGDCCPTFMAGGGMRTGQMIGKLDRLGDKNIGRPVHNHDVLATVYHNLGIDVLDPKNKVTDPAGRPHYLLEDGRPIGEIT